MKFKIAKEVCEKYPELMVYIPIIRGFDNTKGLEESNALLRECEKELRKRFKNVGELLEHKYIDAYFEVFKKFGANPLKTMPTHFALAKRVIEGGNIPSINPIVNIYNALSIKYITPFGGEDLGEIYGDFVLDISKGTEHWKGIGSEKGKHPPVGSLIWKDDFDVSTVALNWRQCDRTKLGETSVDGYFIMDGFKNVNDENIRTASGELVDVVTKLCGGEGEVLYIDSQKPSIMLDFASKSVEGVEKPQVVMINSNSGKDATKKEKKSYVYPDGSIEKYIQTSIANVINMPVSEVAVSQTQDGKYGDYTSPVAMILAPVLKKAPVVVAQNILEEIILPKVIEKAVAVAPGYINFYLSSDSLKEVLQNIDEKYGNHSDMLGKRIMVEYGQPNTHKAVTVGHVKSAITGMSVARLYENIGYEVIHANYFGDLGPYVAKSIYSLVNKVKKIDSVSDIDTSVVDMAIAIVEKIKKEGGNPELKDFFGKLYVEASSAYESDDDITGVIKDINALLFNKENQNINKIYEYTREICIEYLNDFFGSLGVKYDRQYPESEVWERGKEIVKENIGNIFKEDQGAIIFEGKKYGLSSNWVFITSQDTPTYSGKDLGLIELKYKEYPDLDFALVLTSVEQNEYFKGVIKTFELIHPDMIGKFKHIGFGWLLLNNKKTSSRGGTVGYEEMINEAVQMAKGKISEIKQYTDDEIDDISLAIAKAGFKFNILSHEFHKDINYDPKNFLSLSGFSAPYIIYSYTRAISILNRIGEIKKVDLKDMLSSNEELALIRKLSEYPDIVKSSALNLAPHILCAYLYELANTFNSFYTTHRVLDEEENVKYSRSLLIQKTALVIKKGLYLLGIDVIERM